MTWRIDWPRVIGDLAYQLGEPANAGREAVNLTAVAEALDVPRGTMRGWMDGSEPKHADGERLLDRWCRLTGKHRDFAPLTRETYSAGKMAERLDSAARSG